MSSAKVGVKKADLFRHATVWFVLITLLAIIAYTSRVVGHGLGEAAPITGYALLVLFLLLALFNVRKRLSMLPLFRAGWWSYMHVAGGALALALFWLHTGTLWPTGAYEQTLALAVYIVSGSGLFGYLIEKIYPPRLARSGIEVIYERIPAELSDLRDEARRLLIDASRETGSDTLARHYVESYGWFFDRPRFLLNHLFAGTKGTYWINQQRGALERYLNDKERDYFNRLQRLADIKDKIDLHFAAQALMRYRLLVHVPAAVALLVLALWHLLVVNVYAL